MIKRPELNRAFMLHVASNFDEYSEDNEILTDKIEERYRLELEHLLINNEITMEQRNTWTCPKSTINRISLKKAVGYFKKRTDMNYFIIPGMTKPIDLVEEISICFGISKEDLKSTSKIRPISEARCIGMWYSIEYAHNGPSLSGRIFNKNHTSAIFAHRKVNNAHGFQKELEAKKNTFLKFIKNRTDETNQSR